MIRSLTLVLCLAVSVPAWAFAPVALAPADPVDSPWSAANELTSARVGWDGDRLEYEVDYTIEDNSVVTVMSVAVPGGEDNLATFNGWGGAFPTNTSTSIPVDHMSGFHGCGDLFVYELNDGWSSDITTAAGVSASRSALTCDGSAGHTHVEIDWDALCYTAPGTVPPGLTLYMATFIRAVDDGDPADLAPDSATVWQMDTFYTIPVDADWDGIPDGSWNGNSVTTPDPSDPDGDGIPGFDGDCDDNDASAYPGATELCADGADNDCDGLADAADPECGGGDDDDTTPGDDDDTTPGDDDTADDDDTTPTDDDTGDDDTTPTDDDDDDDTGDDDTGDDDTGDDDDTWWDDDTADDDDTDPGDDDTTTPSGNTSTGCTCGNPGLPPTEMAFALIASLGLGLGYRRRL